MRQLNAHVVIDNFMGAVVAGFTTKQKAKQYIKDATTIKADLSYHKIVLK